MNVLSHMFSFARPLVVLGLFLGAVSPALAAKTYSSNGDGTVTDPTTGLIWMRCSVGQTWNGSTCTGTASTYTFDQASALTGKLTFAGQGDWRVPNVRELNTIVDRSVANPAIDTVAFPNSASSEYWTGSTRADTSDYAWYIDLYSGISSLKSRSSSFFVRLVRGGQSSGLMDTARPSTDYIDQGDGTVMHTPTGLTWQRCAVGQSWSGNLCTGKERTLTWDAAKLLTSNLAGKLDWRLPSTDELASLVDYTKFNPAINSSLFPIAPSSYFWSGSQSAYLSGFSWYVYFGAGLADFSTFSYSRSVRLVRGGRSFGQLVLSVTKTGAGQVVSNLLPGIECGAVCSGGYSAGDIVILTASPTLVSWGGACASANTAPTCTVNMDSAKAVTASFKDVPLVTMLPSSLIFSTRNINTASTPQAIALTNTGTTALNISRIDVTGDYAATNNCGAGIGAGGFCTLNVSFTPTVVGTRAGTLTVTTDSPGSPHVISLSGGGQGAIATLSTTNVTFASQNQGTISTSQNVTLINNGGAMLNISSIVANGNFAKTTTCGDTLAQGTSCTISITFNPLGTGSLTGTVVIASDASNSPSTVNLSGIGLAVPALSPNPASLSFSGQGLGTTSAVQPIKLTNIGAAALNLISITVSGDFAVSHNCGAGLGPSGFCNLSVTFTPTATGNRTGVISIASNAPGSPHNINLTTLEPSGSLSFVQGWNLVGNSTDAAINVAATFSNASQFTSIWKWIAGQNSWGFYAPGLAAQSSTSLAEYATSKGYQVLTTISGGEGFWVNAAQVASVNVTNGSAVGIPSVGNRLVKGWNLVSVGESATPKQFCDTQCSGVTTLWAWDSSSSSWYFYEPTMDANGELISYLNRAGYLDFIAKSKTLGSGVGFWVNRP